MKHLSDQLLQIYPLRGLGGLLLCLFILLSGCSSEDDIAPPILPSGKSGITFSMGFTGQDGLKAATDKDFKTVWEPEDEVGLFIVKGSGGLQASGNYVDNLKMEYSGTSWTYTLPVGKEYYPNDGDELHFYAYYPYDEAMADPTSHTFSVQTDQNGQTSGKSNYNLSDLLLAKAENVVKSDNAVQLTFSHAMSLVQVEVKKEINVPSFDDDFTVTLTNAKPDATLNWTNELTGTGTPTDIVMHRVADATGYIYRALLPAQTLAANTKVTFVQTTADKEIDMEYQGVKSTALTAKNAHKYSVTLGWGIDPDHEYAVGDAYPHTGPAMGIVFWLDNPSNGKSKHGKIVGLHEISFTIWADWTEWSVQTYATDQFNGLLNMHTMSLFISSEGKSWSNFPAFEWVHNMNSPSEDYGNPSATGVWYLPAYNELGNNANSLYNAFITVGATTFNNKLTAAGGTAIVNSGLKTFYWSSSEYVTGDHAWHADFSGGGDFIPKSSNERVRSVLAF